MKYPKLLVFFLLLCPVFLVFPGYLIFKHGGDCNFNVLDSVGFRDGDLVFRRGKSVESFAVVMAGKSSEYSHIGVIVMDAGKPLVIHVVPGDNSQGNAFVKKEPLRSFLNPDMASHFAVYRSHLDRKGLSRVALQARIFYRQKCYFDDAYDLLTDKSLYCTELVYKAYRQGDLEVECLLRGMDDVNVLLARRKILMPGAFIHSGLFYKICSQ